MDFLNGAISVFYWINFMVMMFAPDMALDMYFLKEHPLEKGSAVECWTLFVFKLLALMFFVVSGYFATTKNTSGESMASALGMIVVAAYPIHMLVTDEAKTLNLNEDGIKVWAVLLPIFAFFVLKGMPTTVAEPTATAVDSSVGTVFRVMSAIWFVNFVLFVFKPAMVHDMYADTAQYSDSDKDLVQMEIRNVGLVLLQASLWMTATAEGVSHSQAVSAAIGFLLFGVLFAYESREGGLAAKYGATGTNDLGMDRMLGQYFWAVLNAGTGLFILSKTGFTKPKSD